MKKAGIIAEYNPFHNGHKYHIEETRRITGAEAIVAIMSGNFTQRGEPAVLGKFERAMMALNCGADLVLELPAVFCIAGAEAFAKGGVAIARGLNLDFLSFGSETTDFDTLEQLAEIYAAEPPEFKAALKVGLKNGLSYAKARSIAARICVNISHGDDAINIDERLGSNDILAVEYLKQLNLFRCGVKPVLVSRIGDLYNEKELPKEHVFASASAIRSKLPLCLDDTKNLSISRYMPEEALDVLDKIDMPVKSELNNFYEMFVTRALTMSEEEIAGIYGATEGLGNRIKKEIRSSRSFDELTQKVISKRYTLGRINRLYLQILLGITREKYETFARAADLDMGLYARVLGFNRTGAKLIKELKKSGECSIPIITNINKEMEILGDEARDILAYDILATDFYNMAAQNSIYSLSDYVRQPIRV